jgi:HAD superfamily hydrolase (TIGR01459 family)
MTLVTDGPSPMPVPYVSRLSALAPRYDAFIIDLWGVVHDGTKPLPGAIDCLSALVDAGKRIALLSNAPRRADDVVRRITRIGVPSGTYHHVMSSGEEAWQCLQRRSDPFYAALGYRCLHICSDRDLEIRDGLDLEFFESAEDAEFILNTGPAGWEDTVADYSRLLRQCLARRLPMVCANPDLVVMHGAKLALCAGALAQWYEERGGYVRWHGKPYPSVYDTCLVLLDMTDRSRILAVGDSLRTDIAGAAAAGLDSLFIAGGIHAAEFGLESATALEPDLNRIEAALAAVRHRPTAVAAHFCW